MKHKPDHLIILEDAFLRLTTHPEAKTPEWVIFLESFRKLLQKESDAELNGGGK